MRKIYIISLMALFLFIGSTSIVFSASISKLQIYKGAWFQIKYPAVFKVIPSIKSPTKSGYDSAFFVSPDDSVEFYIFSPQWNGNPVDIQIKTDTEEYVDKNIIEKDGKIIRRATIKSKSNKYLRSYIDTEDTQSNTRFVVGVKFQSPEAYDRYKSDYLKFKESLEQFAD